MPIDELPPVVPTPVAFAKLSGTVTIDASTTIVFEPQLENEAKLLADNLKQSFELKLKLEPDVRSTRKNSIRLKLGVT